MQSALDFYLAYNLSYLLLKPNYYLTEPVIFLSVLQICERTFSSGLEIQQVLIQSRKKNTIYIFCRVKRSFGRVAFPVCW